MTLDVNAVVETVSSLKYVKDAREIFGDEGEVYLGKLLDKVRLFFRTIPSEDENKVFVFTLLVKGDKEPEFDDSMSVIATSIKIHNLIGYQQRLADESTIVIRVRNDDCFDLYATEKSLPLECLSQNSLVFINEDEKETFLIGGRSTRLRQSLVDGRSLFATKRVSSLLEALESYRKFAANVTCPILESVWEGGRHGPRLIFRNRPESTMRESLGWFLSVKLDEDASVREEHNTDESKPVDLVVDWFGRKQRALIEVKWLGWSLTRDSGSTRFTKYTPQRAHRGADQLADYLDREESTDPTVVLNGYLTVFDGRRRNVVDATTPISEHDATYYRDKDIELESKHQTAQSKVDELIRYFLEPRQSLLAKPSA